MEICENLLADAPEFIPRVEWLGLKKDGSDKKKKMNEANSSKWRYMRSAADISLKWKDIRNADITPNQSYVRSIADIPKLSAITRNHSTAAVTRFFISYLRRLCHGD